MKLLPPPKLPKGFRRDEIHGISAEEEVFDLVAAPLLYCLKSAIISANAASDIIV